MQATGTEVMGVDVGKKGYSQTTHDFKNREKKKLNLIWQVVGNHGYFWAQVCLVRVPKL